VEPVYVQGVDYYTLRSMLVVPDVETRELGGQGCAERFKEVRSHCNLGCIVDSESEVHSAVTPAAQNQT
jgi:hypothetical protein